MHPVQIAQHRLGPDDIFAVQLDDHPQNPVRGRMLRAEIEDQGILAGSLLEIPVVEVALVDAHLLVIHDQASPVSASLALGVSRVKSADERKGSAGGNRSHRKARAASVFCNGCSVISGGNSRGTGLGLP